MARSVDYAAKIPQLRRQLAHARESFAKTSGRIELALKFFIIPFVILAFIGAIILVFTV